VTHEAFEECMTTGAWRELLFLLSELMTVWKNSFSECVFDDAMLSAVTEDASRL
jgi:hypothetical protein